MEQLVSYQSSSAESTSADRAAEHAIAGNSQSTPSIPHPPSGAQSPESAPLTIPSQPSSSEERESVGRISQTQATSDVPEGGRVHTLDRWMQFDNDGDVVPPSGDGSISQREIGAFTHAGHGNYDGEDDDGDVDILQNLDGVVLRSRPSSDTYQPWRSFEEPPGELAARLTALERTSIPLTVENTTDHQVVATIEMLHPIDVLEERIISVDGISDRHGEPARHQRLETSTSLGGSVPYTTGRTTAMEGLADSIDDSVDASTNFNASVDPSLYQKPFEEGPSIETGATDRLSELDQKHTNAGRDAGQRVSNIVKALGSILKEILQTIERITTFLTEMVSRTTYRLKLSAGVRS